MEYYSRLIQNLEKSESYALVELNENGQKCFKIVNYDNIISKHNVMRLEIPVMVIFEDRLVRKAIIKSISEMIDRLEISKTEFEVDPKESAKRERQDDDTPDTPDTPDKPEKPAKKRKLSQQKKQRKTKKKGNK